MGNVYYLGGSPCCGKSTIAERLRDKYNFQYYKPDEVLEKFISKGAVDGDKWLAKISAMTIDELWLRSPQTLNEEELITYEKLFPYFIADINNLDTNTPIINEGAAFLPYLINKLGIDKTHYACVVPTKEFQIQHYTKRLWVNDYLSSCSDKDKAFDNWMERDALFALSALAQARELEYATLVVDGSKTVDENLIFIESLFQLI